MEQTNTSSNTNFLSFSTAIPPPVPRGAKNQTLPPDQINTAQPHTQSESMQQPEVSSTRACIIPTDIDETSSIKEKIRELLSSYYEGPWLTWTEVPQETKDKIWNAFMGNYKWDRAHERQIRKRWGQVASEWLKKHLYNARSSNRRPDDVKDTIWEQLKARWNTPEYRIKCQKNKQNRAANSGSSISNYRRGSRSTSEHKRKLAEQLGREPTQKELFLKCYGKNGVIVDDRAKTTMEKFEGALADVEEGNGDELDQEEIWIQSIGYKKGRVFGLGNLSRNVTSSYLRSEASSQSQRNSHEQRTIAQQGQTIQKLQRELEMHKSKIDQITSTLIQQGIHLAAPEENSPSGTPDGSEVGSDPSTAQGQ